MKEEIQITDRRLIQTVGNNLENIRSHLAVGNEVLVCWPSSARHVVLTEPDQIRESDGLYAAAVIRKTVFRVAEANNIFFVPPGMTLGKGRAA